MTIALPAPEIAKGTLLGKYEILRKLATGGMAEIYLARVRGIVGFEKLVVLKRILPSVADDPAFVQMFLDEARLAATLQHPNIADVYDVGSENGSYFFTMEFIHGEDARAIRIMTRKTGQPVPLSHALAIVHGTASALNYAHEKSGPGGPLGLVHRDVSASNILVSFDGAVKLVDFGIARATSRRTKTRTGTLKGKIPYMSPEQCQNHPLDRRSDLFSLGVVLYELTVGRRPFRGDSDFAILDQIINKGAQLPSKIVPDYPPELERITMRLLARKADERYQSAEDLVHDLETFMASRNAWTSAIALGRYMRGLFADKIKQWEAAEEAGASLGEHVAETITSESMRAEMRITPVSAFTAQPDLDVLTPVPVPATSAPMPVVRPSRRGLWVVGLGLGAGALAVTAVVLMSRSGGETPATEIVTPTPTQSQVPSLPPAPAAKPAPPAATAIDLPRPVPPLPEPPPTAATVEKPAPTSPKPIASDKPIRKPAAKPVAKPATKPTASGLTKPDDKPKPDATKPPDKDKSWDRNSLYLPKK